MDTLRYAISMDSRKGDWYVTDRQEDSVVFRGTFDQVFDQAAALNEKDSSNR